MFSSLTTEIKNAVKSLGIVFGDIGTSPIYAFRESLKAASGTEAETTVLGVLSLVFWASLMFGAVPLSAADVWQGLQQPDGEFGFLVHESRLPRSVLALLVGAQFARESLGAREGRLRSAGRCKTV